MMHGWIGKCWGWCHNKSIGQLVLRLVLGLYFIGHAVAKLQSMSGTVVMFQQWGFAPVLAYAATISELLAGAALVLGVFLWFAAVLITVVMAVAVYFVTGPNPDGEPMLFHFIFGWGPNAIYAAAAIAMAFTGAGKWSLTGLLMRRKLAMCNQCNIDHGIKCQGSCVLCGCGKE